MAICTRASTKVTPIRAATMEGVLTGASRSRRNNLLSRHVTSVRAAPKVAWRATAHPSSPGVTYWMLSNDSSSTCWGCSVYVGGWPVATRLAWDTYAPRTPWTIAACTWSAWEK